MYTDFGGDLAENICYILAAILIATVIFIVSDAKGLFALGAERTDLEKLVEHKIRRAFHTASYNLIVTFGSGLTTEIDRVFVTRKGIFSVECKERKGNHVYGDAAGPSFFVKGMLGNGRFQNPFKQNDLHIKALKDLLASDAEAAFDIPIFNVVIIDCSSLNVIGMSMGRYISRAVDIDDLFKRLKDGPDVLTKDQVRILNNILKRTVSNDYALQNHISQVQFNHR